MVGGRPLQIETEYKAAVEDALAKFDTFMDDLMQDFQTRLREGVATDYPHWIDSHISHGKRSA